MSKPKSIPLPLQDHNVYDKKGRLIGFKATNLIFPKIIFEYKNKKQKKEGNK